MATVPKEEVKSTTAEDTLAKKAKKLSHFGRTIWTDLNTGTN